MKMKRSVLLLAASLACGPALADEAQLKKTVESRLGTQGVTVAKTPYAGLYEVRSEGQILYTDSQGAYFFDGDVIDAKTGENITQKKVFGTLPLERAIKTVRGNGKRMLVTFEDPNCAYCKKLAKDMQSVSDITIYTFLYPILSQDSYDKSRAIWCSSNRAKAWSDWMVGGIAPAARQSCQTPVEQNVQLGRRLNVRGTPTLLLPDGRRLPGAVPAEEIERALAAVK
ncbi:MAG: DsbC family protein [Rhodocyclaceae bacterium]